MDVRSRRPAVAMLALMACAACGLAFQSFEWWGGAQHYRLLREALEPYGLPEPALLALRAGADSQDGIASEKFTASPQNHADDNELAKTRQYVADQLGRAMLFAEEAWARPDAADKQSGVYKVLFRLGEALHTAQDFYCHSNYVEYTLAKKLPFEPVDWARIPSEVRSGQFYWSSLTANEGTAMSAPPELPVGVGLEKVRVPTAELDRLVEQRRRLIEQLGGKYRFHSDTEFRGRLINGSYQAALDYVTDGRDLLHYELAKDHDASLQGRVQSPGGNTLFALAGRLAMRDTQRQWLAFETRLQTDAEHASHAPWILAALKGRPRPLVTIQQITVQSPVKPGALLSGSVRLEVSGLTGLTADPTAPIRRATRLGGTLDKGFQRRDATVPGDGVIDVPLAQLGLKAPDEAGPFTVKLEAVLEGDPQPEQTSLKSAEAEARTDAAALGDPGFPYVDDFYGPGKWVQGEDEAPTKPGEAPITWEGKQYGLAKWSLTPTTYAYSAHAKNGAGQPTEDFEATWTFDRPPAVILPGQEVVLRAHGTANSGNRTPYWFMGTFSVDGMGDEYPKPSVTAGLVGLDEKRRIGWNAAADSELRFRMPGRRGTNGWLTIDAGILYDFVQGLPGGRVYYLHYRWQKLEPGELPRLATTPPTTPPTTTTAPPTRPPAATEADRKQAAEHLRRGSDLADDEKWAAAEAEYRAAVKLDPAMDDAWSALGEALGEQRRWADAVGAYRQAVALSPQDAEYRGDLAWALLRAGRRADAVTEAREALRLGLKDHQVLDELKLKRAP